MPDFCCNINAHNKTKMVPMLWNMGYEYEKDISSNLKLSKMLTVADQCRELHMLSFPAFVKVTSQGQNSV